MFDLGYLGVEKHFCNLVSSLPYEKKRNPELSKALIDYNLGHAKRD
ncbi:MAG: hypothetical protein ABJB76_12405 [Candidatus Nitrosocosmicus sp.]